MNTIWIIVIMLTVFWVYQLQKRIKIDEALITVLHDSIVDLNTELIHYKEILDSLKEKESN